MADPRPLTAVYEACLDFMNALARIMLEGQDGEYAQDSVHDENRANITALRGQLQLLRLWKAEIYIDFSCNSSTIRSGTDLPLLDTLLVNWHNEATQAVVELLGDCFQSMGSTLAKLASSDMLAKSSLTYTEIKPSLYQKKLTDSKRHLRLAIKELKDTLGWLLPQDQAFGQETVDNPNLPKSDPENESSESEDEIELGALLNASNSPNDVLIALGEDIEDLYSILPAVKEAMAKASEAASAYDGHHVQLVSQFRKRTLGRRILCTADIGTQTSFPTNRMSPPTAEGPRPPRSKIDQLQSDDVPVLCSEPSTSTSISRRHRAEASVDIRTAAGSERSQRIPITIPIDHHGPIPRSAADSCSSLWPKPHEHSSGITDVPSLGGNLLGLGAAAVGSVYALSKLTPAPPRSSKSSSEVPTIAPATQPHTFYDWMATDGFGWELPAGPFRDAARNSSTGEYDCPVRECGKKYLRSAEYKRHVGSAHLSPFACIICKLENDRDGARRNVRFGRREVVEEHMKTTHGVRYPLGGVDYYIVAKAELEAKSSEIFGE